MDHGPVHFLCTTNTVNQCIIPSPLIRWQKNLDMTVNWVNSNTNDRVYHLKYAIVQDLVGIESIV